MNYKIIVAAIIAIIAIAGAAVAVSSDDNGTETGSSVYEYETVNGWRWVINVETLDLGNGSSRVLKSIQGVYGTGTTITADDWPSVLSDPDFINHLSQVSLTTSSTKLRTTAPNLESIEFAEGVGYLNSNAFFGHPTLKSIKFSSTMSAGDYLLSQAPNVERITVASGNNLLKAIDNVLYRLDDDGNPRSILAVPAQTRSVTIPDTVTKIETHAFYQCIYITSLEFPDSVTLIRDNAFYGCTGLTHLEFPDSVTEIQYAFQGCTNLDYVIVPANVKMHSSAFPSTTQVIPRLGFDSYPTADMIIRQVANMQYEFSTTTAGRAVWDIEGASYSGSIINHKFASNGEYKITLAVYDENDQITHKTNRTIVIDEVAPPAPEPDNPGESKDYSDLCCKIALVAYAAFFILAMIALFVPSANRKITWILVLICLIIAAIFTFGGGLL